jgi:hypothetical protein
MRPKHGSGTTPLASHGRDPRLHTEGIHGGDTNGPPARLDMHPPCRFQHSVVARDQLPDCTADRGGGGRASSGGARSGRLMGYADMAVEQSSRTGRRHRHIAVRTFSAATLHRRCHHRRWTSFTEVVCVRTRGFLAKSEGRAVAWRRWRCCRCWSRLVHRGGGRLIILCDRQLP